MDPGWVGLNWFLGFPGFHKQDSSDAEEDEIHEKGWMIDWILMLVGASLNVASLQPDGHVARRGHFKVSEKVKFGDLKGPFGTLRGMLRKIVRFETYLPVDTFWGGWYVSQKGKCTYSQWNVPTGKYVSKRTILWNRPGKWKERRLKNVFYRNTAMDVSQVPRLAGWNVKS